MALVALVTSQFRPYIAALNFAADRPRSPMGARVYTDANNQVN